MGEQWVCYRYGTVKDLLFGVLNWGFENIYALNGLQHLMFAGSDSQVNHHTN